MTRIDVCGGFMRWERKWDIKSSESVIKLSIFMQKEALWVEWEDEWDAEKEAVWEVWKEGTRMQKGAPKDSFGMRIRL